MKSNIDPFSLDRSKELRAFDRQIFNMLNTPYLSWLAKHGFPNDGRNDTLEALETTNKALSYLFGEALSLLHDRVNGCVDLVTPETVEEIFRETEPDPEYYSNLRRD